VQGGFQGPVADDFLAAADRVEDVMPEAYIMAKLEAKRDRMIFLRIGPISGM